MATPAHIRRVARRVVETRQRGHDVVVVVSAMGNTTNDLLDLAKIESGKMALQIVDFSLEDLVQRQADSVMPMAETAASTSPC